MSRLFFTQTFLARTVLVNGQIAFEGDAGTLERDHDLQAQLLGVVQGTELEAALKRAAI